MGKKFTYLARIVESVFITRAAQKETWYRVDVGAGARMPNGILGGLAEAREGVERMYWQSTPITPHTR